MSPLGWMLTALAVPALIWLLLWLAHRGRRAWAARAGAAGARRELDRRFGWATRRGGEVVVVPTALVDLPYTEVCAAAAERGFRLVGFDTSRGPFPDRVGVFVRTGGAVDRVLAGETPPPPEARGPERRERVRLSDRLRARVAPRRAAAAPRR